MRPVALAHGNAVAGALREHLHHGLLAGRDPRELGYLVLNRRQRLFVGLLDRVLLRRHEREQCGAVGGCDRGRGGAARLEIAERSVHAGLDDRHQPVGVRRSHDALGDDAGGLRVPVRDFVGCRDRRRQPAGECCRDGQQCTAGAHRRNLIGRIIATRCRYSTYACPWKRIMSRSSNCSAIRM